MAHRAAQVLKVLKEKRVPLAKMVLRAALEHKEPLA